MSKKKGLSFEEKRTRMMEFFYDKKDFFQLKDLEKMCPKEKGITPMSVKEVVQSLVDDCMVDSEKIGTSIYFWSFPSKASQKRKSKIADLEAAKKELIDKKKKLADALAKAREGKEDSEERSQVLKELKLKEAKKAELKTLLEQYRESDPEVLKQIEKDANVAKEAANRWTDNIFSTKSWIKRKFSFEDNVIDKQFGIPSDFDYLE